MTAKKTSQTFQTSNLPLKRPKTPQSTGYKDKQDNMTTKIQSVQH